MSYKNINKIVRELYIAECYTDTKVHHELCRHIINENANINIDIYSLSRAANRKNDISSNYEDINYNLYLYRFNKSQLFYKYIFPYKVYVKYKWLKEHVDLQQYSFTHGSMLFSEGVISLKIYRDYGIPYVVSVRGTDVDFYYKYMPHLWGLGNEILNNASKIVFITQKSLDKFSKINSIKKYRDKILEKSVVIPNAIEDFWLQNIKSKKNTLNPRNLLYIGRFDSNKNVLSLVKAVLALSDKYPDICLTLVGGGGEEHEKVLNFCRLYPEMFKYKGKIYDKEKLLCIYDQVDIFTMVSHRETFGLVYLEALSQGLPVVYTKGQGIDNIFSEKIGEAVNSRDVQNIVRGIDNIISNYELYKITKENILNYSWANVAKKMIEVYESI